MRVHKLLVTGIILVFVLCIVTACGTTPQEEAGDVQVQESNYEGQQAGDRENEAGLSLDGKSGYVTICYEDGNQSVYDNAFPLHQEEGYPAVNVVITSVVGDEGKMTAAQLQEMEAAGWETGSHSVTHEDFETLDNEQVKQEIRDSAQWLASQGLTNHFFTYPFAEPRLKEYTKEHYDAVTLSSNSMNFVPVDPYNLNKVPFFRDNLDHVNELLDNVGERNAWVILYTHSVYPGSEEPDEISINTSHLQEVFEKVEENNLDLVTISQGIEIMSGNGEQELDNAEEK